MILEMEIDSSTRIVELAKLEREMALTDGPPTKEQIERLIKLKYGDADEFFGALGKRAPRVAKHFGHVQIDDDQHEGIEQQAKDFQNLIAQHPYIKTAIEEGWAKLCIQEDGSLGLEFTHGRTVHLHDFDSASEVLKACDTAARLAGARGYGSNTFFGSLQKVRDMQKAAPPMVDGEDLRDSAGF